MAFGWLEAPGKVGADIACGEAMSFGNKLSWGGPYLGFIAVKDAHKREIPGRVIGQTKDLDGQTGYVLTLTSREQHIRRDKATSNICSNQGLVALRANIFLQLAGPEGLKGLAEQNAAKAQYLQQALLKVPDFKAAFGTALLQRVRDPLRRRCEEAAGRVRQGGHPGRPGPARPTPKASRTASSGAPPKRPPARRSTS